MPQHTRYINTVARIAEQYGEGGSNQILSTIWGDTLHIADGKELRKLTKTGKISPKRYFRAARRAHLKYLENTGLGTHGERLARLNTEGGIVFELGPGRGDLAELLMERLWDGLTAGIVHYVIAEISVDNAYATATRVAKTLSSLGKDTSAEDILSCSLESFSSSVTMATLPPVAVVLCDANELLQWAAKDDIKVSVVLFPESAMHMDLVSVMQSALQLLAPDSIISAQYIDLNPIPDMGRLNAIIERIANAVLFRPIAETTFMQRRFWPQFVEQLTKRNSEGKHEISQIDLDEDIKASTEVTLELLDRDQAAIEERFGKQAFRTMKMAWMMIRILGQGYYQILITN